MKKVITIGVAVLCSLLFSVSASAASRTSYNYNSKGQAVSAPEAYTPVKEFGGKELGIGAFSKPNDLYCDYKGNLYICDSGNNRIVVLNPDYSLKTVLSEFVDGYFTGYFENPCGVYVDPNTDILYIADTGNARVIGLNQNMEMIIRLDKPYQKGVVEDDFVFSPTKVAVDNGGRIFVVSQNTYEGLMQFDSTGNFLGFVGANKVSISPIDYFWKKLSTKAQASKLQLTLPTEFSNLEIDSDGFIYTTTSILGDGSAEILVRRQNPAGDNVIKTSEFLPIAGDIDYSTEITDKKSGPSSFVDVAIAKGGMYSVLDAKRGRVFTYDFDGNLLYLFGNDANSGNSRGSFYTPSAMILNGEQYCVLDLSKGSVTVFEPTEYGQLINQAVALNFEGEYEQAATVWKKVLRRNCNLEQAYTGVGIAQLRSGDYKAAMASFRAGANKNYYSKAFKQYRQAWLEKHFIWIAAGLVLILTAVAILLTRSEKKRLSARHQVITGKIRFAFYAVAHPFDGFFEMKRRKMGSMGLSVVLVSATVLVFIIRRQMTGFLLQPQSAPPFNLIDEVVKVIGVFALFCLMNWCVSTLMDGEGKLSDIIHCTATCLIPLILSFIPLTLLSNVLTLEDASFYYVLLAIVLLYTAFLLVVGVMETHQYTFLKTLGVLIITLIGMGIALFIGLLFVNLINTLFDFCVRIYNEAVMR